MALCACLRYALLEINYFSLSIMFLIIVPTKLQSCFETILQNTFRCVSCTISSTLSDLIFNPIRSQNTFGECSRNLTLLQIIYPILPANLKDINKSVSTVCAISDASSKRRLREKRDGCLASALASVKLTKSRSRYERWHSPKSSAPDSPTRNRHCRHGATLVRACESFL